MTRRLRHRLGRWLLRDAPSSPRSAAAVHVHLDGKEIHRALLKYQRRNGGGSMGLS